MRNKKYKVNVVILFLVGFIFGWCIPGQAETIKWNKKTGIPVPLFAHTAVILGKNIHVVTGRSTINNKNNYHFSYRIQSNTWEKKKPFPAKNSNAAAVVCKRKIYVIGGNENPSKVFSYEPATDKWRQQADMPTPRQHINYSAVSSGNRIYVIGGLKKTIKKCASSDINPKGKSNFEISISKKNEIYDPDTDTWAEGAPMPTPREAHSTALIGNKIYTIGGFDQNSKLGGIVEVYDIQHNSWEKRSCLPDKCFSSGISVIRDKIYVITAAIGDQKSSKIYCYDPAADMWEFVAVTPKPMKLGQMVSFRNRIFILGGAGIEGISADVYESEPGGHHE